MSVHYIQVLAATTGNDTSGMSLSEINTAMDDWVSKNSEWTADPTPYAIGVAESEVSGEEDYYSGEYRFELADAKANLLDKCGDKLKKKVDWFRLLYHECLHDTTGGCSHTDKRDWTSKNTSAIPGHVRDLDGGGS